MSERSGTGAIWILLGLGLVGVGIFMLVSKGEDDAEPLEGRPREAQDAGAPPTVPPPGPALAPAGFLIRRTDEVPSATLTLAMSDEDGHARVCVVGREALGDAPLDMARCRDATVEEVAPTPRREPTEPHAYGDVVTAWLVHTEGAAKDELFVRSEDGRDVEIGDAPPSSERIRACRSASGLVLVVDGKLSHDARDVAFTFFDGGAWSAPVVGAAQQYETALTCRDGEATLTWLEAAFEGEAGITLVHQVRCRATGCEAGQSRVSVGGTDWMAADLAGQVLLVWASDGGTRARLGPLATIGREGDLGPVHDEDLPVLARRLFVRGGVAIVTVRTAEGLYGFRIDTTKRIAPLGVEGGP
jgi:hypothetical protein